MEQNAGPMTPQQLAIVDAYFDANLRIRQIIDYFVVSAPTIYNLVHRAKEAYPDRYGSRSWRNGHMPLRYERYGGWNSRLHRSTSEEANARAARFGELYQSGATLQEIADTCNPPITRERVRQILRAHGYASLGQRPKVIILSEQEEAAIAAYKDCVKISEIEKTYGVNSNKLNYLRRALGIPRRRWDSQRTRDRDLATIQDYYHRPDLTLAQIAKKHGFNNVNEPCRLIARFGYPRIRKPANFKARGTVDREAILQDLVNTSLTMRQIMKKHNVSTLTIGDIAKRNNIDGRVRRFLIETGRWPNPDYKQALSAA